MSSPGREGLKPEELAAYEHVDRMTARADAREGPCEFPSWHGWALRESFLAGVFFAGRNGRPEALTQEQAEALAEAISRLTEELWPLLVDALNARHPEWAFAWGKEAHPCGESLWVEVNPR